MVADSRALGRPPGVVSAPQEARGASTGEPEGSGSRPSVTPRDLLEGASVFYVHNNLLLPRVNG
jgi:hypothetical protein